MFRHFVLIVSWCVGPPIGYTEVEASSLHGDDRHAHLPLVGPTHQETVPQTSKEKERENQRKDLLVYAEISL